MDAQSLMTDLNLAEMEEDEEYSDVVNGMSNRTESFNLKVHDLKSGQPIYNVIRRSVDEIWASYARNKDLGYLTENEIKSFLTDFLKVHK